MTYSVAIRTLGLSPDSLRQVLERVFAQTLPPARVVVYIAKGYTIPSWRVGNEQYVSVDKGMMRQRALKYREIDSDYILMLDDDLLLSPTAASSLIAKANAENTDVIAADPFENHKLPLKDKLYAGITALVFPHIRQKSAYIQHSNGSFSYIHNPQPRFYKSDTCAGPIMLWRRNSFSSLNADAENWIDSFDFAYGDDALLSYKATANGMKVGVDFSVEVTNLDSRTSSDRYRNDPERFYIRTKAMFSTWWRMCYKPHGNASKGSTKALLAGTFKFTWLVPVMLATSVVSRSTTPIRAYFRGLRDGYKYVHSEPFSSLPPYIIEKAFD